MPIYEYQCDDCKKKVEVMQKISDAPITKCDDCGGHLTRLISTSSFCLKGGGWYKDGYASCGCGQEKSSKTNNAPSACACAAGQTKQDKSTKSP